MRAFKRGGRRRRRGSRKSRGRGSGSRRCDLRKSNGEKIKRNLADGRLCGGLSSLSQRTGTNVENVGDVSTFVNARFDECEVPLPVPVAPEEKSEEGENEDAEEYTDDYPSDSTLWNTGGRRWTVKGAVGDPGRRHIT